MTWWRRWQCCSTTILMLFVMISCCLNIYIVNTLKKMRWQKCDVHKDTFEHTNAQTYVAIIILCTQNLGRQPNISRFVLFLKHNVFSYYYFVILTILIIFIFHIRLHFDLVLFSFQFLDFAKVTNFVWKDT